MFPEWVGEAPPQGRDKELVKGKAKTLGMFGFEALTVEAVRQLKAENASLKAETTTLKARLAKLESQVALLVARRYTTSTSTSTKPSARDRR